MRLVFNQIPRLAKVLYGVGFLLLLTAMLLFFYWPALFQPVKLLQAFVLGAIVVALGSVVNTLHQFKHHKSQKKE